MPADTPGPAAEQGTQIHWLAESYAKGFEPKYDCHEIGRRWNHLRRWLADKLASLQGAWLLIEHAYAYDVDTDSTRELSHVGRDYGHTMREVPGRLDLAAVWSDHVQIYDYKTGRKAPHAEEARQLRTNAVQLLRLLGQASASVSIVHVTDSGVRESTVALEPWDVDAHAAELREQVDDIPNAEPRPGPWCDGLYCPLRTTCEGRWGETTAKAEFVELKRKAASR